MNFPVFFPVSRELVRRRVRSALRRQPASLTYAGVRGIPAEKPALSLLFASTAKSPYSLLGKTDEKSAVILR